MKLINFVWVVFVAILLLVPSTFQGLWFILSDLYRELSNKPTKDIRKTWDERWIKYSIEKNKGS